MEKKIDWQEAKLKLAPILKRMPAYTKLIYMLYNNPALTAKDKTILSAGLIYALSPIDLIPGFIPVVGQLDDIIIALEVLQKVLKRCSPAYLLDYEEKTGINLSVVNEDLAAAKAIAGKLAYAGLQYLARGVARVSKYIYTSVNKRRKKDLTE